MRSSLICLLPLFLFACKPSSPTEQKITAPTFDWKSALTYEIFVQSFADSDGDRIGDLKGITQKLDYLDQLGVEAIWLMPIHPSPSYHKYDVVDYKAIHPDYGTMNDFKEMLAEAHRRGIKVMIDLVLNHTSEEHPWFQAALQNPESKYRDYYVWASAEEIAKISARESGADNHHHPSQWHENLLRKEDQKYYGFFWKGMPDLNYDNPEVRKEALEIGRFWLEEIGIDGFRLDAARYIYLDSHSAKSRAWWQEFREEMQTYNPEVYLVGEVWADAEKIAPYLRCLHACFNFDLGKAILKSIQTQKADSLLTEYQQIQELYQSASPDYVDAIFLTNHDQNRVMSALGNHPEKAKLAASMLLTLPGAPYIYYGEEIGMKGKKPDEQIREPFLWDVYEKDAFRTKWITPQYNTEEQTTPLAVQKNDERSIFRHYQSLIRFRQNSSLLKQGKLVPAFSLGENLLSFYRVLGEDSLWVVHNLSEQAHKIKLSANQASFSEVAFTSFPAFGQKGKENRLPAYQTVIFSKKNSEKE